MLYELIRTEFPDAILVSVSHRSTVEQFHGRHLELDRRRRVAARPAPDRALDPRRRSRQSIGGILPGWTTCSPRRWTGATSCWTSLWWIAKAWVIAAVATMVILVLIDRFTTWGRQFWRVTGDYFRGPESVKVWIWLARAVAVGDRRRSHRRAAVSYQGNDMMTSFQVDRRGPRQRRRGGEEFRQGRLLAVHERFRHPGHHPRRPRHAGPVPDAAVHAAVARLADRSAHRGLAGRQGLLPGPLHRRHDRQPGSAHPDRHRHLHRRCRTTAQHPEQHLGGHAAVRRGLRRSRR